MDSLLNELAPKKYLKTITGDEQKQLRFKTIPLCNTIKKKADDQIKKSKVISAKEKKKLKLFGFKDTEKEYALYVPLHHMWKDYMNNLMEGCEEEKEIERRVSKADFHGCIFKVIRSKCPSLVGLEGINLIETKNMFIMITQSNKIKKVPKSNTTFLFSLNDIQVLICGDNFRFKASERTVRNFKMKPLVEIKKLN